MAFVDCIDLCVTGAQVSFKLNEKYEDRKWTIVAVLVATTVFAVVFQLKVARAIGPATDLKLFEHLLSANQKLSWDPTNLIPLLYVMRGSLNIVLASLDNENSNKRLASGLMLIGCAVGISRVSFLCFEDTQTAAIAQTSSTYRPQICSSLTFHVPKSEMNMG